MDSLKAAAAADDAPSPREHAAALARAVAHFRARDPEGWDRLALCPLQHGLETMLRKLRAFR